MFPPSLRVVPSLHAHRVCVSPPFVLVGLVRAREVSRIPRPSLLVGFGERSCLPFSTFCRSILEASLQSEAWPIQLAATLQIWAARVRTHVEARTCSDRRRQQVEPLRPPRLLRPLLPCLQRLPRLRAAQSNLPLPPKESGSQGTRSQSQRLDSVGRTFVRFEICCLRGTQEQRWILLGGLLAWSQATATCGHKPDICTRRDAAEAFRRIPEHSGMRHIPGRPPAEAKAKPKAKPKAKAQTKKAAAPKNEPAKPAPKRKRQVRQGFRAPPPGNLELTTPTGAARRKGHPGPLPEPALEEFSGRLWDPFLKESKCDGRNGCDSCCCAGDNGDTQGNDARDAPAAPRLFKD